MYWLNKARDLHASAVVLESAAGGIISEQFDGEKLGLGKGFSLGITVGRTFHMVAGLSLEVLLKGCMIRRDGDDSKVKPIHDLLKLCKVADFNPAPAMRDYLEAVTVYIMWLGKYPIALSKEKDVESHNSLLKTMKTDDPEGQRFRTYSPDETRGLSIENYEKAWKAIELHFFSYGSQHNGDIGYDPNLDPQFKEQQ